MKFAYTAVLDKELPKYIIGKAEQGRQGYTPMRYCFFDSYKIAQEMADQLNKDLGLSRAEAWEIVAESM